MLNTMLDRVLDPGALTDFEGLDMPDVISSLLPEHETPDLTSATGVRFESGATRLEVFELLDMLRAAEPDVWNDANYFTACELAAAGQAEQAATAFLSSAALAEHKIQSLYGLATQLHAMGQNKMAHSVASFLTRVWPEEPRSLALLGTIDGALGHLKEARKHLSGAAHMSRRNPKFVNVLRYSQKQLLQQQFSDRRTRPIADALKGS
ncbi:hypothetical protein [Celeribacter sp.]|uniref:hypothetical protein n=1 Tax=Celeribacter sp. TaxID=1890673 RepID=UPI003A8FD457